METLKDLIKGCIDKDHQCQRKIYEQFYGYALKIVFRYISEYEKAVDIVNDGFVKVFNTFIKFRLDRPEDEIEKMLMGWMKKILINSAIDELRKSNNIIESGDIREDIWDLRDRGQSAEQKLFYKDLICEVKKLPPSYRIIFNMFAIDGYTHFEISKILGISLGASKSGLSKAKAHLQKYLSEKFPGEDIWT